MSQILGFFKPKEEENDIDKAELLYQKRRARLDQIGVEEVLATKRSSRRYASRNIGTGSHDDGEMGGEAGVKSDLSIPAQTHTSFVPYITSVSKLCLQPMANSHNLIALIFFVFHPFAFFSKEMKNKAMYLCIYGFVSLLFHNVAFAQSPQDREAAA